MRLASTALAQHNRQASATLVPPECRAHVVEVPCKRCEAPFKHNASAARALQERVVIAGHMQAT
eukprot:4713183-Alexandrium_andersonii.AAC.1